MSVWTDEQKSAAHAAVRRAIAERRMTTASTCARRDKTCSGNFHWHHESYAEDRYLDVVPLCASHHFRRHSEIDGTAIIGDKRRSKIVVDVVRGMLAVRCMHVSELAERIGVTRQAVNNWLSSGFSEPNLLRCLKALDADQGAYDRCGVTP